MKDNSVLGEERRLDILKGISQGLKPYEISAQLGANRREIMNDIRYMRRSDDLGLKQAESTQALLREKKVLLLTKEKNHFKQNERFQRMTGITLKEKSFRNMIDFHKHELLKILKSKDQQAAIIKLSKNTLKTLKRNGILTNKWHDGEITERAQEYLTRKNSTNEL